MYITRLILYFMRLSHITSAIYIRTYWCFILNILTSEIYTRSYCICLIMSPKDVCNKTLHIYYKHKDVCNDISWCTYAMYLTRLDLIYILHFLYILHKSILNDRTPALYIYYVLVYITFEFSHALHKCNIYYVLTYVTVIYKCINICKKSRLLIYLAYITIWLTDIYITKYILRTSILQVFLYTSILQVFLYTSILQGFSCILHTSILYAFLYTSISQTILYIKTSYISCIHLYCMTELPPNILCTYIYYIHLCISWLNSHPIYITYLNIFHTSVYYVLEYISYIWVLHDWTELLPCFLYYLLL